MKTALSPGRDGPAPAAAPEQRRGPCPRCGRRWALPAPSPAKASLRRGDRVPPPLWLRTQNREGEDSANPLNPEPSPQPAGTQVHAPG